MMQSWYNQVKKYAKQQLKGHTLLYIIIYVFPLLFYILLLLKAILKSNNMVSTVILRVSYLLKVNVVKVNLQDKDGHFQNKENS
jgi:multisubunit Na+/H+ antiporter MnhE subunit